MFTATILSAVDREPDAARSFGNKASKITEAQVGVGVGDPPGLTRDSR